MGAADSLNAAPTAPFTRRVREIPPKAGISRVIQNGKITDSMKNKVLKNLSEKKTKKNELSNFPVTN